MSCALLLPLLTAGALLAPLAPQDPAADAAAAQDGRTYTIVLERARAPGDRYHLVVKGTRTSVTTLWEGAEALVDDTSTVDFVFEAVVTVLELDGQRPIALRYLVERFSRSEGEETVTLLPVGSVLEEREQGRESAFQLEGTPVEDPALLAALDSVGEIVHWRASRDEIFGSATPRRAGERWEGDAARLKEELEGDGLDMDNAEVTVHTTLEELVELNGTACMVVVSEMAVKGQRAPFPEGFEVDAADASARLEWVLPLERGRRVRVQFVDEKHRMHAWGPQARELQTSMEQSLTRRHGPVPVADDAEGGPVGDEAGNGNAAPAEEGPDPASDAGPAGQDPPGDG